MTQCHSSYEGYGRSHSPGEARQNLSWITCTKRGIIALMGSEWCHPLVVTAKANGKIRMCVDFCNLNCHVERPIHPMTLPNEAISRVSASRFFGTANAIHGYWQTLFEEKSQLTTVFITPWGRYKYLRAPMGLMLVVTNIATVMTSPWKVYTTL